MKNFAIVINGIVENVIIADDSFATMWTNSADHDGECFEYFETDTDDKNVARIGEAYLNGKFVNGNQAVELGLLTVDEAKAFGFHSGQEYREPEKINIITMRQARLALFDIGIKDTDVRAVINSLPSPLNEQALIEWDYASEVDKNNPLIAQLMSALNLTNTDIDNLFINGVSK